MITALGFILGLSILLNLGLSLHCMDYRDTIVALKREHMVDINRKNNEILRLHTRIYHAQGALNDE